ncbi:uncharacterized protein LOC120342432 [Styela clava]
MELSTGIEVESDFGESSGDEWELEDISSSSDESTTPIFIRQFSSSGSSDMPSTSSASTSTTRSRRGRPVKRRWSRGRRSSREEYVLPSPPQPEPVVTPRHTQPVHLEPPPSCAKCHYASRHVSENITLSKIIGRNDFYVILPGYQCFYSFFFIYSSLIVYKHFSMRLFPHCFF